MSNATAKRFPFFLACICEQAYLRKWQETLHWTGGWNVLTDVLSDLECMDVDYGPRCTDGINNLFWSV